MRVLARRIPVFFTLLALATLAAWAGVSRSPFDGALVTFMGNYQCANQTLAPGEYQQVEVPSGDFCVMGAGVVVDQDVNVDNGATLTDTGATIDHDLHAHNGSNITINGSSGYTSGNAVIGHDLHGDGVNSFLVQNTSVGHDVQVNNLMGSGNNYFNNSCAAHDVHIQNGQNTAGTFAVNGNNGTQCGISLGIGHDLHVENNKQPVSVSNNTVGNDLHVQNNRPGGATVTNNHVTDDAQCQNNQPFAGSGNVAGGKNTCNGTGGGGGAGKTQCTGTLPPGTYQQIEVPTGATCTLASGDNIQQDVQVDKGASLVSNGANIGGTIQANQAVGINLTNTNVLHDLQVSNLTGTAPGGNQICSTNVGGNLVVQNNLASAGPITIGDTSTGCASGTNVTHDLQVQGNQDAVDVSDNNVGGNLTVANNKPGGATVVGNNVVGNAQCQGNSPFTASGNSANKNQGC